jgi:hypothetical protein
MALAPPPFVTALSTAGVASVQDPSGGLFLPENSCHFVVPLGTRSEPMVSGLLNHAEVPELAHILSLISGPFEASTYPS